MSADNDIGTEFCEMLAKALENNKTLSRLRLGSASLLHTVFSIRCMPVAHPHFRLHFLKYYFCSVCFSGTENIFEAKGCKALANTLKMNSALTDIDIGGAH
eukprot:6209682-Pleurochrysis_carterae.AAC.2